MEWTRFLKTCQEFYSFSEERISVLGQGKWMNWGNLGKDHCLKFGFPWKPTLRPRLEKQVCCLGLVSRKHWEVRQGREGSLSRVHFQADSHCGQRKINSTREFWEPEQKHTSELRPSKEEGMEIFVHQLLFVRSLYLAFFFFFLLCWWTTETSWLVCPEMVRLKQSLCPETLQSFASAKQHQKKAVTCLSMENTGMYRICRKIPLWN